MATFAWKIAKARRRVGRRKTPGARFQRLATNGGRERVRDARPRARGPLAPWPVSRESAITRVHVSRFGQSALDSSHAATSRRRCSTRRKKVNSRPRRKRGRERDARRVSDTVSISTARSRRLRSRRGVYASTPCSRRRRPAAASTRTDRTLSRGRYATSARSANKATSCGSAREVLTRTRMPVIVPRAIDSCAEREVVARKTNAVRCARARRVPRAAIPRSR